MKDDRGFKVCEPLDWPYLACSANYAEVLFEGTLLEAVDSSLQKWKVISTWYEEHPEYKGRIEDGGSDTCALCSMFSFIENESCKYKGHVCPIRKHTGVSGCRRTPCYVFYSEPADKQGVNFVAAAKGEVDFLIKIRCEVSKDEKERDFRV